MLNLTDKERLELLGEVFMDELRVIREYLSDIPIIKQKIERLETVAEGQTRLLQAHDYEFGLVRRQLAGHDNILAAHDKDIRRLKKRVA